MWQSNPALVVLFMKEFQWCQVKLGESIAIVTEPDSPQAYLVASIVALAAMEARPFQVMLPIGNSASPVSALVGMDHNSSMIKAL